MIPILSSAFVAIALMIYVVLDGFDLGVGILLLFETEAASRDHMVDSITPTWDGNETWLIMAGVTLLASFPIAYGILLPAFYLPIIVMLLALGLRGVSFEFRMQMKQYRQRWDRVFAVGSTVAAAMQGLILGSLIQGVRTEGLHFDGSVTDVFRPLPILSAITIVCGYSVLGSGWLNLKADGKVRRFAAIALRFTSTAFGLLFCLACLFAVRIQPKVGQAWSNHPTCLCILTSLFVILSGSLSVVSGKDHPLLPFLLGLTQFVAGISGLALVVYPYIVPFGVSLFAASASPTSQKFVLFGVAAVAPIVIAYSAFAYWIFRGRTPPEGWGG